MKYVMQGTSDLGGGDGECHIDCRGSNLGGRDDVRLWITDKKKILRGQARVALGAAIEPDELSLIVEGDWEGKPAVYTLALRRGRFLANEFRLEVVMGDTSVLLHQGPPLPVGGGPNYTGYGTMYAFVF